MSLTSPDIDLRAFYGGEYHVTSGESCAVTNPATGVSDYSFTTANEGDVAAAVSAARDAFDHGPWAGLPPMTRRFMLLAFAAAIEKKAEVLAAADSLDMGKPISAARQEVGIAAGFIRYYAEAIDKFYPGQIPPTPGNVLETQIYRPRGVIAAITPWNFPIINAALKLGPALAAGNTVVIKPSEIAPRSTLELGRIANEAGLPPGVLNIVPGAGPTGQALVSDRNVDMVTFTGSTATGKALMRLVGESSLKPLLLECGGKSPEIVCADMAGQDLNAMGKMIAQGAFWNQGQVCVARSRLIVHSSLADRLLPAILLAASSMKAAEPHLPGTMFGPMASKRQYEKVLAAIASGLADGAKFVLDGRKAKTPGKGFYIGPSVFTEVPAGSSLEQQEIFGPVLSMQIFDHLDQAIELANTTEYGLAATIWTRDSVTAHSLSYAVRSGRTKILTAPIESMGALFAHCFEPAGQSGFGIDGGLKGMASYMRLQSIEHVFG